MFIISCMIFFYCVSLYKHHITLFSNPFTHFIHSVLFCNLLPLFNIIFMNQFFNKTLMQVLWLLFYRWRNWGSACWGKLPKNEWVMKPGLNQGQPKSKSELQEVTSGSFSFGAAASGALPGRLFFCTSEVAWHSGLARHLLAISDYVCARTKAQPPHPTLLLHLGSPRPNWPCLSLSYRGS